MNERRAELIYREGSVYPDGQLHQVVQAHALFGLVVGRTGMLRGATRARTGKTQRKSGEITRIWRAYLRM